MNELKERFIAELTNTVYAITEDWTMAKNIVEGFKVKINVSGSDIRMVIKCDLFTYEYLCRNLKYGLFSECTYTNEKKGIFIKYLFD